MIAAYLAIIPAAIVFGRFQRLGWGGAWRRWVAVTAGLIVSAALVFAAVGAVSVWWQIAAAVLAVVAHAQAYNLPGHGESMDMGRMDGTEAGDFQAMVIRYTGAAAVVGVLLAASGAWWAPAMVLVGPIPAFGYRWAWRTKPCQQTWCGEQIMGAAWYGALGGVGAIGMLAR